METNGLVERIQNLQTKVARAAQKSGRKADDIKIVYVTKTIPVDRVRSAIRLGARDLGENRVQEFMEKRDALVSEQKEFQFRWHLIGHLQTNKVKYVVGQVTLLHSLDRLELAAALEKEAATCKITSVPCLVQVNSSGESTKFGLAPSDVESFVSALKGPAVKIQGLMTIGPLTDDEKAIRSAFSLTRELRDNLKKKFPQHSWETLSMGMSGDYEMAIEEGSTLVRVGTAVFGERQ